MAVQVYFLVRSDRWWDLAWGRTPGTKICVGERLLQNSDLLED